VRSSVIILTLEVVRSSGSALSERTEYGRVERSFAVPMMVANCCRTCRASTGVAGRTGLSRVMGKVGWLWLTPVSVSADFDFGS